MCIAAASSFSLLQINTVWARSSLLASPGMTSEDEDPLLPPLVFKLLPRLPNSVLLTNNKFGEFWQYGDMNMKSLWVYSDHEWLKIYSYLMLMYSNYCGLTCTGIILNLGSRSLGKSFIATLGDSLGGAGGPPPGPWCSWSMTSGVPCCRAGVISTNAPHCSPG